MLNLPPHPFCPWSPQTPNPSYPMMQNSNSQIQPPSPPFRPNPSWCSAAWKYFARTGSPSQKGDVDWKSHTYSPVGRHISFLLPVLQPARDRLWGRLIYLHPPLEWVGLGCRNQKDLSICQSVDAALGTLGRQYETLSHPWGTFQKTPPSFASFRALFSWFDLSHILITISYILLLPPPSLYFLFYVSTFREL